MVNDEFARQLSEDVYKKVASEMAAKLTVLEKQVKDALEAINKRSQETLGYLVRQATQASEVSPLPELAPEAKTEESVSEKAPDETI